MMSHVVILQTSWNSVECTNRCTYHRCNGKNGHTGRYRPAYTHAADIRRRHIGRRLLCGHKSGTGRRHDYGIFRNILDFYFSFFQIVDTVMPNATESLIAAFDRYRAMADAKVACNYALTVAIPIWNTRVRDEMTQLCKEKGVNSFTMHMGYKQQQLMLRDGKLVFEIDTYKKYFRCHLSGNGKLQTNWRNCACSCRKRRYHS